ncbi:AzlD domain-containing protein [Rhizobium sp. KVB221]|uniref:AzlD domain-containing protein n=1 Tax=Rhizobium setariae TaxID=2801340 RepID=A0A936YKE7_9HYPH|nr:AzlD domain-containing protein [Rhizobium setariae]MBL0371208.1 AzlD domain-containing protein [Rhizobium setariae]
MSLDYQTFLAILAMAAATALTRVSGAFLLRFLTIGPQAREALDAIPPAVLMAVIAPTALATGWAETIACAVTALAALRLPLLACVVIGVLSVVALRAVGL